YTNAGKSTLMNEFVGEGSVHAEDRLFATLDTTVRQVELKPGRMVLLSDTVGFIRKLPSPPVASFRTPLAEPRESDLLLHVVDGSSPTVMEQISVVDNTLKEIGADDIPVLMVLNKIDLLEPGSEVLRGLTDRYPDAIPISAVSGLGVAALREKIATMVEETYRERTVRVSLEKWHHIAKLHDFVETIEERFDDEYGYYHFRYSPKIIDEVEKALSRSSAVEMETEEEFRT